MSRKDIYDKIEINIYDHFNNLKGKHEVSNTSGRLHVAVLIANIGDMCQNTIIDGINDCAHRHDIDISIYIGSYETLDNDFVSHYETCYEIISSSESLDGLIIFTGFIAPEKNFEKFITKIVKTFENIPTVSVTCDLPGIPAVLSDNVSGIFDVVNHLIEVHGKKNIVYIGGPKGHLEAEERLEGYKKVLATNNIVLDERYILPGNFTQKCGIDAVTKLIDKLQLPFDAIVACDDITAFGAIKELKSRGVSVPKDVAVTGFDDDRVATTFTPSLATVRQNFHGIGEASLETLIKVINGDTVEQLQHIACNFTARQSCGCLSEEFLVNKSDHDKSWEDSENLRTFILKEFMLQFHGDFPNKQIEQWVDTLVNSIKAKAFCENHFFKAFDGILIDYSLVSNDFLKWFEALNALTAGVDSYVKEVDCVNRVLSSLIHATRLVQDACNKIVKVKEFELVDDRQKLSRISSTLVMTHDLESLSYELSKALPLLSLDAAIIGLYKNNIRDVEGNVERNVETFFGFSNGKVIKPKYRGKSPDFYSIHSLTKKTECGRRTQCILPLFYKDEEMGILSLPYDNKIPTVVYEAVRMSISSAIKGIQMLMRIQELSMTDELTGLLNRRGLFQFVSSRLRYLQRNSDRTSLIMFFDIDGLKLINDNLGHSEGDLAIATFARILKKTLRGEDIVGRVGGDEFVAFTTVKSAKDGVRLEKRIRSKFVELNAKKKYKFELNSSIGIVKLEELTMECFEATMLKADSVLYEEKRLKKMKIIEEESSV